MARVETVAAAEHLLPAHRTATRSRGETKRLLVLLVIAGLELLLAGIAIVRPLALISRSWPGAGPVGSEPLEGFLGRNSGGIERYLLVAAAAVGVYLAAYVVVSHCHSRRALLLVLGFATAFALILLAAYPASSRDVFTNIFDGRLAWRYNLNPMTVSPNAAANDPLFSTVTWQNEPSYYGPFWYLLLIVPARLVGSGFVANLVAYRAVLLPFFVGSAYMAARVAYARAPRLAPAAALFVGFSPLLLWEIMDNGHNDIVMAFFAMFALERAQRGAWATALPLLALSILTKYTTVILVPLFVLAAVRGEGRRCLPRVLVGALLALGLTVLVFIPFWDGTTTLDGLLHRGANRMAWSPATLLAAFLHGKQALPSWIVSTSVDMKHAEVITVALFCACYAVIARRLWRGHADLLASCFYSLFFYQVLLAWWFFPAYLCPLVVVGGALVGRREATLALIFSTTALLAHVVQAWWEILFTADTTLAAQGAIVTLVFAPAVVYWLSGLPRPAWLTATLDTGQTGSVE